MHVLILTRYWPFDMVTKKSLQNFFLHKYRKISRFIVHMLEHCSAKLQVFSLKISGFS